MVPVCEIKFDIRCQQRSMEENVRSGRRKEKRGRGTILGKVRVCLMHEIEEEEHEKEKEGSESP